MKCLSVAAAMFLIGVAPLSAQPLSDAEAERMIRELQASHIKANVPVGADFDRFLRRDLDAYFAANGIENAETRFELLRQGATQTGVAYPKFYLWVSLSVGEDRTMAGAVRVVAVERIRFQITDFLPANEIVRDPDIVAAIFPAPLIGPIRERATRDLQRNLSED